MSSAPPAPHRRTPLLAAALCVAALAAAPASALAVPVTSPLTATNGIYTVNAFANGASGAVTGADHPAGAGLTLTYSGRSVLDLVHSYTSDADYRLGGSGLAPDSVTAIPDGVRQSYEIAGEDSLEIQRDATVTGTTPSNSVVRFTLRVRNTGDAPVGIGARTAIDFKLANDDGPVFTPEGGVAATEPERYVRPAFATFSLQDNETGAPTLLARWSAATTRMDTDAPDVLDMADCCVGDGPPLLPAASAINSSDVDTDNAVSWIWGPDEASARTLAPGDSARFSVAGTLARAIAPVNTAAPSVSGTATVGETLTADPGSWSDSTPMTTFSSQWERLVEGAWTPIAGAATATYVPTAGDLGHALRVRVGTDGAADALSEPTQPVRAAAEPTPAATPTPVAIPVAPDGHATLEPVVIGVASGDTTVTVVHDSVGVRCAMSGATLRSCRVELFADPTADGARASRVVRIGSGTVHAASPASRLSVHVKLNRTGRRLLRRSPTGLDVRVNVTGDPVEGATLHGRTSARLVAPRATLIIGGFGPDAARLTRGARAALRTLAGQLDAGSRVRIAGYTAHGHRTLGYLRGLGLRRAAHVRDFLVAKGAKARTTVLTHGPGDPEAGNGTARGRALNRRVVLTIVR